MAARRRLRPTFQCWELCCWDVPFTTSSLTACLTGASATSGGRHLGCDVLIPPLSASAGCQVCTSEGRHYCQWFILLFFLLLLFDCFSIRAATILKNRPVLEGLVSGGSGGVVELDRGGEVSKRSCVHTRAHSSEMACLFKTHRCVYRRRLFSQVAFLIGVKQWWVCAGGEVISSVAAQPEKPIAGPRKLLLFRGRVCAGVCVFGVK